MLRDRPRIAWFSVVRATGSMSRFASSLLLPLLREHYDIEVFSDFAGDIAPFGKVEHFLNALTRHSEKPFDIFFYQLEDIPAANFIKIHLGLMPGIVWFHHVVLGSDIPEPIMNSPWQVVLAKFRELSSRWAELPWAKRDAEHKFKGPLAWRELQYSLAPLFSTEWGHGEFRRMGGEEIAVAPNRPSGFVPLPVPEEVFKIPAQKFGARLRLGLVGAPRIESRTHKILQAVSASGLPVDIVWLVDGRDVKAAEAQLHDFELTGAEVVAGRSPEAWGALLPRIDCAAHTSYSVYGHPGPYLEMSLAAGRACLVSDFGATEYLPDQVAFKIMPGEHEVAQITKVLQELHAAGVFKGAETARAFAFERSSRRAVAGELAMFIEAHREKLAARLRRWEEFRELALRDLIVEVRDQTGVVENDRNAAWRAFGPWFAELGWGGGKSHY